MLIAVIIGLAGLIFALDLMTPLGVAGGVPYIVLVLLSYRIESKKAIPASAILGSVLTILGFFLSPSGGELWKVLFNRVLALFAIWAVAWACMKNKAQEEEVHKLTEAIDQSPNPVVITDTNAKIEYVNFAFVQKSGYSEEEALGNTPRMLKSGKHPPEFYRELWETILSGNTWQGNIFNRRKDGTLYWECLQISPLRDAKGKISHFFSLRLLDKQRELADREVNKLTHTLDQIPQAVLMTNKEGIIVFANPAFEKITGYSLNDVVGMNPNLLKSGKQTPKFYEKLWETITTGNLWRGKLQNKRKDGKLFWESVVISPVFDDKDQITHFIAIRDDITSEKEKELRLKEVQKQLVVSEKLAGIGQLAAGICHEVLNPLNIISVKVQMLIRKHQEQPELISTFQSLLKETARIVKILQKLLAFARQGKNEFEAKSVEIVFSEEVLPLVENDLKLSNIAVERKTAPSLPKVNMVPDEMSQVFFNLINNAKYAMPQGGKIKVAFEKTSMGHKDYLRVRFSDNGTGIKKENLEKIFDPFFTTKPEGEGTGMGLSACHGIIEKHGGNMTVESEEGIGTAFLIDLPALEE